MEYRSLQPAPGGDGSIYCAFLSHYDCGDNLRGAWRISGLRLPQLAKYLASKTLAQDIPVDDSWPSELLILRSQLLVESDFVSAAEQQLLGDLRSNAQDETRWRAYSSWMTEHGKELGTVLLHRALAECTKYPVSKMRYDVDWTSDNEIAKFKDAMPEMDTSKAMAQYGEHIVQISVHNDHWEPPPLDLYSRWIIFDDLWASANRDLANSILTYANRWDVLSD